MEKLIFITSTSITTTDPLEIILYGDFSAKQKFLLLAMLKTMGVCFCHGIKPI